MVKGKATHPPVALQTATARRILDEGAEGDDPEDDCCNGRAGPGNSGWSPFEATEQLGFSKLKDILNTAIWKTTKGHYTTLFSIQSQWSKSHCRANENTKLNVNNAQRATEITGRYPNTVKERIIK